LRVKQTNAYEEGVELNDVPFPSSHLHPSSNSLHSVAILAMVPRSAFQNTQPNGELRSDINFVAVVVFHSMSAWFLVPFSLLVLLFGKGGMVGVKKRVV
jgi:hypothetical protein